MPAVEARYSADADEIYLSGVQALLRLVLEARWRDARLGLDSAALVSGYQGSPLGGFDLELARRAATLADHRIVHQPAVNEELAATALIGSQLAQLRPDVRHAGVLGLWYGKAPGLDRASDALRHGNLIGATPTGGVVVAVGDDAQAKSSTVPSASELMLQALAMPILSPADPREVVELGLHAFAMSRASGCWVGLKMATAVADATQSFAVPDLLTDVVVPALEVDGRPFQHRVSAHLLGPRLLELERSLHGPRLALAEQYGTLNGLNRVSHDSDRPEIGLVASGVTYLELLSALRLLGLSENELGNRGIRILKIGQLFPLDPGPIREFSTGLRRVVVVEEKRGILESQVKDALYGRSAAPAVLGKRDEAGRELMPASGELGAAAIAHGLAPLLLDGDEAARARSSLSALRPAGADLRTPAPMPYFCSGCPHNTGTKAPKGALVGAGIGCHGMALTMDPGRVGDVIGLVQMGGEGAQWIGMAPFVETEHFIQNIGDGTFSHSGSLAVRAAVAASANITYKLLVNSAVAMTGGQQAQGGRSIADWTRMLQSEGVRRIIITADDPERHRGAALADGVEVWSRDRIEEAQRALAATKGVTVLIHDQACAIEKRRGRRQGTVADPPERVMINERVCEGCGDCGAKSNCLSVRPVETEFGRKTQIHQASCSKDYTCVDGDCPAFLEVIPARPGSNSRRPAPGPPRDLPAPARPLHERELTVRLVGLGGTGVVTAAQVLAAAATLEGFHVRGLDQTGLAQKAGAVISDLRLSRDGASTAPRLAPGECDVLLACDLLAAAQPEHLAAASSTRTEAAINTAITPTGRQVRDVRAVPHDRSQLVAALAARCRSAPWCMDAAQVSTAATGSDQAANIVLLGAAWQRGLLPLEAASIERAIEANGVAIQQNLAAFRRGREEVVGMVCDPGPDALVKRSAEVAAPADAVAAPAGTTLRRVVDIRVEDLCAYQNSRYAMRYAECVERVRRREATVTGEEAGPLAEAVARQLHRLMAYKDEYEVARLHLDPALTRAVEETFGPGARVAFKLHPPMLRALGLERKLTLGPWFRGPLRGLRAMRRLRGTPFDAFGYTKVRRTERSLIREYCSTVDRLIAALGRRPVEELTAIAMLPERVSGYEDIKLARVGLYRQENARRLNELEDDADRSSYDSVASK